MELGVPSGSVFLVEEMEMESGRERLGWKVKLRISFGE
jgi:hypothetical protein